MLKILKPHQPVSNWLIAVDTRDLQFKLASMCAAWALVWKFRDCHYVLRIAGERVFHFRTEPHETGSFASRPVAKHGLKMLRRDAPASY